MSSSSTSSATPPASGESRKCDPRELRRRWKVTAVIVALFIVSNSVVIGLPIRGQVVSAVTRQPIPHAKVLAWWRLDSYGLESLVSRGLLQALETETDSKGRYSLPPWVRLKALWLWNHQMSPSLLIFQEDHVPRRLLNSPDAQAKWLPMRFSHSQWSGQVIELEDRPSNRAEFARALDQAVDQLRSDATDSYGNPPCLWPKMRRTLEALNRANAAAMFDTRSKIRSCGQAERFAWERVQ